MNTTTPTLAALILALTTGTAAQAQQFVLSPAPDEVLAGEPLSIRLSGFPADTEITLHARRTLREWSGPTRPHIASARFRSHPRSQLDLATAAPLDGGSYQGARFSHLPGPGKRPALIVFGASEGGSLVTRSAPADRCRGYAVLALPYCSPPGWDANGPTPAELPGLPAAFAGIPIERLEQARAWLAQQPEVDVDRIGVVGTRKGCRVRAAGCRAHAVDQGRGGHRAQRRGVGRLGPRRHDRPARQLCRRLPAHIPVSGASAGAGTHAFTGAEQAKERTPASPACRD